MAASTVSDITRELPSPRSTALAVLKRAEVEVYQAKLLLTPETCQDGGLQVSVWPSVGVNENPTFSILGEEKVYGVAGIVRLTSREIFPFLLLPVTMQVYVVLE
jgi:hypothetical protein